MGGLTREEIKDIKKRMDFTLTWQQEKEIEAQLYDSPFYGQAIEDFTRQLAEIRERIIGNPGTSIVSFSGKTNNVNDRTGSAAVKLADNPAVHTIERDLRRYRRLKTSTERILNFLEKYGFAAEKRFIELYYFERKRIAAISKDLNMGEKTLYRFRKKVLYRIGQLKGMIR
jgi:RinA family phage transcriptional activator